MWHLKYGLNPHQGDAQAACAGPGDWLRVLNGQIGYINLLDGVRAWWLARELAQTFGRAAASSIKHTHPAGAALAAPLDVGFLKAHDIAANTLSEVATAYARARAGDPLASFGDVIGLSEPVDESCARLIAREVSDGIVAPAYDRQALNILRTKKSGRYVILEADPTYVPPSIESRSEAGLELQQARNSTSVTAALFDRRVSHNTRLTVDAVADLQLATIVVKHTASNAVCIAHQGQAIGIGGGQQARIYATREACDRADAWRLHLHPRVAEVKAASRTQRVHAIRQWIEAGSSMWQSENRLLPAPLPPDDREKWLAAFAPVVLSSDGYIPFRDNVDRAKSSGVHAIAQPGGSINDASVIAAADEAGMVMVHTGVRLFLH